MRSDERLIQVPRFHEPNVVMAHRTNNPLNLQHSLHEVAQRLPECARGRNKHTPKGAAPALDILQRKEHRGYRCARRVKMEAALSMHMPGPSEAPCNMAVEEFLIGEVPVAYKR